MDLHEKIKEILQDPGKVYEEMMENNPEFREFVEENKENTIEEIMKKYHIRI